MVSACGLCDYSHNRRRHLQWVPLKGKHEEKKSTLERQTQIFTIFEIQAAQHLSLPYAQAEARTEHSRESA